MTKAVELRELDGETLEAKVKELDDQLFRMRIQKAMGQLEAPGKIRNVRRDLARIQTVLREKAK
jgi:large subunit ribosomal protein L29